MLRRAAHVLLALVALAGGGCASPPAEPSEPRAQRRSRLERELSGGKGEHVPWVYHELGALDEEEGDLERAVSDYGAAVALLPPRRVTRPALALGRVHLRLGRHRAARNLLEEVLATVPSDPRLLRENPDYRAAALGLREVFAREPDAAAERRVRARFLDELGGGAAEWPEPR